MAGAAGHGQLGCRAEGQTCSTPVGVPTPTPPSPPNSNHLPALHLPVLHLLQLSTYFNPSSDLCKDLTQLPNAYISVPQWSKPYFLNLVNFLQVGPGFLGLVHKRRAALCWLQLTRAMPCRAGLPALVPAPCLVAVRRLNNIPRTLPAGCAEARQCQGVSDEEAARLPGESLDHRAHWAGGQVDQLGTSFFLSFWGLTVWLPQTKCDADPSAKMQAEDSKWQGANGQQMGRTMLACMSHASTVQFAGRGQDLLPTGSGGVSHQLTNSGCSSQHAEADRPALRLCVQLIDSGNGGLRKPKMKEDGNATH